MNFTDTLSGLWRRWYVILPGILIAASLAVSAWFIVPPGYERSSTQLLIPGAQSMPEGANPYLFLGGLAPAADVIVRAVGSENLINEVIAEHPGVEVEVTRDTSAGGPVILTVVTAASDAAAEEVLGLLGERTAAVVDEIQETEGIAAENRMTVLPITIDSQSVLKERNRFLAVGAAGLIGLALTLLISALVDGFSLQRKRGSDGARSAADVTLPPGGTLDAVSVSTPTSKALSAKPSGTPVMDQSPQPVVSSTTPAAPSSAARDEEQDGAAAPVHTGR